MRSSVLALFITTIAPFSQAALINLNFLGSPSPVQQQIFNDAADFWNSTITGFKLDYTSPNVGPGTFVAESSRALSIDVTIEGIDGVGGVLGSAGPTYVGRYQDTGNNPGSRLWYTAAGAMSFDTADVANMISNNTFYSVVLHEMGHILGIGTLWAPLLGLDQVGYVVGSGEYYGSHALANWQNEFNRPSDTYVPVELAGGSGTANGHWNEVDGGAGATGIMSLDPNSLGMDFSQELMTGWASSSFFVSSVTLGSLEDLGYDVDYSRTGLVSYASPMPEVSHFLAHAALLGGGIMLRSRKSPV